jgi:hypothetical protein
VLVLPGLRSALAGEGAKVGGPASVATKSVEQVDRNGIPEVLAVFDLMGPEAVTALAASPSEEDRARAAVCRFYGGDLAGCLDIAGPMLDGSISPPMDVHLYGAIASYRLGLWPLVLRFTHGDPDGVARFDRQIGRDVDASKVRLLHLYLALAWGQMDRFEEAAAELQRLSATSKDDTEKAALEQRLGELRDREKAIASGKAGAFSESDLWVRGTQHGSSWVRADALGRVARKPMAHIYDMLVAATEDASAEVRSAAAEALGERGDKRAIEAVRALLADPSQGVRDCAKGALQKLGENVPAEK